MTVKKEPAACSIKSPEQATGLSHLTDKLYPQTKSLSSLQSEIREILWCLEFPVSKELAQSGCKLFEQLLRRYVGLRILQNPPEARLTRSESTILSQGVSE